jgi:hypothetical protein
MKSCLGVKSQNKDSKSVGVKSQGHFCLFTSYLTLLTSHNGIGVK